MFEDEINSLSEPYLTANDGEPYPLYPNEVRVFPRCKSLDQPGISNKLFTL